MEKQRRMINQAEVLMQSAEQQYAHLQEALCVCTPQPPGYTPKVCTDERSSKAVVPRRSRWTTAVQAVDSPPLCRFEQGVDEEERSEECQEEEAGCPPRGSQCEASDAEEGLTPVTAAISYLIDVKGWAAMFQPTTVSRHAISTRIRNDLLTQESFIQRIVRNKRFDWAVGFLILANAVFIGLQVEFANDERFKTAFLVGSIVFCGCFFAELSLRVFCEGRLFCLQDPLWNAFDTLVVASSVAELCMQVAVADADARNNAILQFLRVLRFIRVVRVFKVMRAFRELRMMIFSMLHSLHSIVWAIALLLTITFIFGIIFTQAVKAALQDERAQPDPSSMDLLIKQFGSVPRTMLTLVQAVLGGFSWADISDKLKELHWAYELLFFTFEAFSVLALLNVVTGVFVDGAMRSAANDRDLVIQDQMSQDSTYMKELRKLFMEADVDRTGCVSLQEFLDYVQDERVQSYLRSLDIHISEAKSLFHLLDIDDSGELTVDEFIAGFLRFKGEAKGVDVLTLMYENKKMVATIVSAIDDMMEDLRAIRLSTRESNGRQQGRRRSRPSRGLSSQGSKGA